MELSNIAKKRRFLSPYSFFLHTFNNKNKNPLLIVSKTLVLFQSHPISISHHRHFHTKPTSKIQIHSISSTGYSSLSTLTLPIFTFSETLYLSICRNSKVSILNPKESVYGFCSVSNENVQKLRPGNVNSIGFKGNFVSYNKVKKIVQLVISDVVDLESRLDALHVSFSLDLIKNIFISLNNGKISALRFFRWYESSRPELRSNPEICSLVIDNCGRRDDHEVMMNLLSEFRSRGVALTKNAFRYLVVSVPSDGSLKDSVRKMVSMLNNVGGACRASGIHGLIEMFCDLGSYEMASHVIQITERKASYYNALIRGQCRKCNFQGVNNTIEEMRQAGCPPTTSTYNYLLSALCKNGGTDGACEIMKEMQGTGCPPDSLTFDILIHSFGNLGKLDSALKLLNDMVLIGIEPRLGTHALFVKAYFEAGQHEEAHKFADGLPLTKSSNMVYSLLAKLHQEKGNYIAARDILVKMMEKGLTPKISVYRKTVVLLHKIGEVDIAHDLKNRFDRLKLKSRT